MTPDRLSQLAARLLVGIRLLGSEHVGDAVAVHDYARSGLLSQPQRGVEVAAVRGPGAGGPRGPDDGTERGAGLPATSGRG